MRAGVGNLKDGTQDALGQRIQLIFIGVHRLLAAARIDVPSSRGSSQEDSLAADERR